MRQLLLLALLSILSTPALATLEFALRGDAVGTNSYTDPANNPQQGASYVDAEYARMFFRAKITDSLSGVIVMDFLQVTGNAAGTELFKVAELNQKFSDTYTFGIGRLQDAGIGGYEGLTPVYDLWTVSTSFFANYPMGVDLDINFTPEQQLKFVLLNQGWDQGSVAGSNAYSTGNSSLNQTQGAAGTTTSQTQMGYGARWRASWTKEWSNMLSVDVDPTYNANTSGSGSGVGRNMYVVASGQYKTQGFAAYLDYMNYTFNNVGTNNFDTGFKTSIVGSVKYDIGHWTPRLKFELSTIQDVPAVYFLPQGNSAATNFWGETFASTIGQNAYTDSITRIDVGTDYHVSDAQPFYYSAHVVSSSNQFSNGPATLKNGSINETGVYVSVIGRFDVLK